MRAYDVWLAIIVLLAGAFIGDVELHTTEPTVTVALIGLFGLLAGFAQPRLFWLSGLILGASVPAAYAFAATVHFAPREWPQPEGVLTNLSVGAFTLVVGLIAACVGAMAARATARGSRGA
jgi:hypothetical protein